MVGQRKSIKRRQPFNLKLNFESKSPFYASLLVIAPGVSTLTVHLQALYRDSVEQGHPGEDLGILVWNSNPFEK